MSLIISACLVIIAIFSTGCVTFNDIRRVNNVPQEMICADITFKQIINNFFSEGTQESELDNLSRLKILQVLSTLQISTKCETNKLYLEVKIHRKFSQAYAGFLGGWSIFSVLSVGLIPTYSSFDTEISVAQNGEQKAQSTFHYTAAIWLPFIIKNISDDVYSFQNYKIDSRAAVIGIEVAKLIRTVASEPKLK